MLYAGYVSSPLAFAFACAAMLEGKLDWAPRWTSVDHGRLGFPLHRDRASAAGGRTTNSAGVATGFYPVENVLHAPSPAR